jgi:ParB-like chromosome segregation protein Spo0J
MPTRAARARPRHEQTRPIAAIRVGRRHRKDLGDLESLAESLERVGLLHPVVIDATNRLIAGQRRLEAAKLLGWQTVPVRVIDLEALALGEFVENACRKGFTPSEIAAIARVVRPLEEEKARRRRLSGLRNQEPVGANCHHGAAGKTRDIVARFTGISGRTLDKIAAVVDAAEDDPARYGHLKEEMDAEPRSVHRCYRRLKAIRQRAREQAARSKLGRPHWTITADQAVVQCHLGLFDPPYGITRESWEPEDLESFTRGWSGPWAGCGADFIAIFWSQARLFEGRRWFDESLAGYGFQQVLVWHANNNAGPKNPRWLKQTWEPIFLYRRHGASRRVVSDDKTWTADLHNLDCHVAPVPQTNYTGHDLKQHPTQKPVSVMRWLIHALTEPGEKVASVFCGVAPCGIAALQLGRT